MRHGCVAGHRANTAAVRFDKTIEIPGGGKSGIMHACGHDVHMTNLTGVAQYLSEHFSKWSGTLMLVGQPAEERGGGAKAMLREGIFERFAKPDYALAVHVCSKTPAGKVAFCPVKLWPMWTASTSQSKDVAATGRSHTTPSIRSSSFGAGDVITDDCQP